MCHNQLAQLRGKLVDIQGQTAQVLAIDPHEIWSAKFMLKEVGLSTDDLWYPLLMDPSLTVSATYGVVGQMRVHTEWSNRPATFIIDKDGIIRYARRGQSFGDRPKPDEVVAELKKLSR